MEIKSTLKKPYTSKQRADFIVAQNYNLGYEIKETNTELQAWGLTEEEQENFDLESKKSNVKAVRDSMIDTMTWRIERAKEQQELGIETVDDYGMLLEYRQYLRDYPDKTRGWWKKEPLSYEDWCKKNEEE